MSLSLPVSPSGAPIDPLLVDRATGRQLAEGVRVDAGPAADARPTHMVEQIPDRSCWRFELVERFQIRFAGKPIKVSKTAKIVVVRLKAFSWFALSALDFSAFKLRRYC